jgi:hypothetical protein
MEGAVLPVIGKKFPIHPAHSERNCWGCDRYCAADAMLCGNGSERTPHPVELFGDDWLGDMPTASPSLSPTPSRIEAAPTP